MPNGTTTAVQHRPKSHLRLPTTSWLRPSSFDKPSCPYVGQWSCPINRGQSHHGQIYHGCWLCSFLYSSRALSHPTSSKTRPTRHTSTCACNLPKNRTHTECVFQYNSHQWNGSINLRQLCLHTASAMNRQLWLRQALSTLNAETWSQENQKKTENQQLRIFSPPPNNNI